MMNRYLSLLFILIFAVVSSSCGRSIKVKRVEVDNQIDLSGKWNDTDSRLVSEEMIRDCLERPWYDKFLNKYNGKLPDVIVGTIRNKSHEHINVQTFIKDLERSLINSGNVNFVASRAERGEIRDERVDQAKHSSDESMKSPGKEAGADFMLIGSINTILDEWEGEKVMYYQVDLELIDIESNRKAWIGNKKIKKHITKRSFSF